VVVQRQRQTPRLSDEVADTLRRRILHLEFADGSKLPKQEQLVQEFGVSLPSIREALRTLEAEGLVTVQRGKIGGSVVHLPRSGRIAYMLGLVLESKDAEISDVIWALTQLEPLCARACALRKDRKRTVVPLLEQAMDAAEAELDDPAEFIRRGRHFHDVLVQTCGNESLAATAGALQELWAAHLASVTTEADLGEYAKRKARERSVAEHREMTEYIVAGDADNLDKLVRAHSGSPWELGYLGRPLKVEVGMLNRR
jgi:GntR family transcriptional repressor for pyruvate dehydrogenase complex